MKTTGTPQIQPTPVRLPDDLKEDLKKSAVANDRSLNGEIVNRLRATFEAQPQRATRPGKGVTQK